MALFNCDLENFKVDLSNQIENGFAFSDIEPL